MRLAFFLIGLLLSVAGFGQTNQQLSLDELRLDISCSGGKGQIILSERNYWIKASESDSIMTFEMDQRTIEKINVQINRIALIPVKDRMRKTIKTCRCHGNYYLTKGNSTRETGTFVYDKPPLVLRRLTRIIDAIKPTETPENTGAGNSRTHDSFMKKTY